MNYTSRSHWQLRLANVVFVLLFLGAVGLLHWLSRQYSLRLDLTGTGRHSLSEASIAATERLKGPVKITAFVSQRGDLRARIQALVERYRRHKPDMETRFVDPDESPAEVRAAGVQHEGELLLEHADAKERIAPPSHLDEETFTNALTRLGHRGERWIVFLSGHGERSPDRQANFDLSTWSGELGKRGFKTRTLSLGENPRIPENTAVFVIAGPRARLLAGEVKEIRKYLERGGNLLWLSDPGPLLGLEPLAETLGIEFLPGTVVDPSSQEITGNAALILVSNYGAHPVVRDFANATLFPQVGALQLNAPKGWQGSTLLDTRPSAWLETGPLGGRIAFDKGKDMRGPLTLAATLTRNQDKHEQRVAVIADGDFLSNSFLANAGNLDLALSLINWLSRDDAYVNIPVRAARDRRLELSHSVQLALVGVFLVVLPLGFIGGGVSVWWRRRKR
jgi:ABC-type uncharacterized transport system involved in gliding motility auxiliary subunit